MTWIADPRYDNLPGYHIEHRNGIDWIDATVHHRWQRHRAQTRGNMDGENVERCACGAFGPAPWTLIDRWPSRKSRRARSNLPVSTPLVDPLAPLSRNPRRS